MLFLLIVSHIVAVVSGLKRSNFIINIVIGYY